MRAVADQVVTQVEAGKPLTGRVVLVTRAREQAGAFAELLEAAGARVLLVPTIAIEPPESWDLLDAALDGTFTWVIF
ncbi:MAG TPA: uroporphyrinogen-III synthase, partial [Candidatus Eisenbacteria bacterium]|nr:uroporphyrinogen-III synthase [Candidatus Eisenbacteria bacterium]